MALTTTMRRKLGRLGDTVSAARQEGGVAQASRTAVREMVGGVRRVGGYAFEAVVDRRYGMVTRGIVKNDAVVHDQAVGGDGCYYQATPVGAFRRIVRESGVDPARTVFLDLGAGRGRALLLAADLGFRRVVGVELDPVLCTQARANAGLWRARHGGLPVIEVRTGDAAAVDLPPDDLFVFLFNPFGAQTLGQVLRRLAQAQREHPRRITLAYLNPVHAGVVETEGTFMPVARGRSWAVYSWEPLVSLT
jgi:SAM-dependent methyltransferase